MGRHAVKVMVRMRPTDHFATQLVGVMDDQKTITVQTNRRGGLGESASPVEQHAYKMDQVFVDASQEAIFDACAADIVKSVVAGYNGTVMAYGQTGAGKTYTMMGGSDYRTRGVVPRSIKAIFDEVSSQVDKQFEVRVSYIEVYNDRITDLLAVNASEDITIQEDSKGAVAIRGATHALCTSEAEALSFLFTGNGNRAVAPHSLNAMSSRSHCIFTVHVTSRSRVESESASLVGKLHCVDLAGSERLSKTDTEGALLREAQYINKSLTFLEQVVMALGTANRHVPFRQSKLTNILKDSLGGNSKTTMIANVWPEERHMEETVSTLKFASRMMRVQTDASVNTVLDPETHIRQLQRKITELKAELQMQNQLAGKSHITYEGDIGEDERFEMEKTVRSYITGRLSDIEVRSLREVREYFRIFKAFVDSMETRDSMAESRPMGAAKDAPAPVPGGSPKALRRQSVTEAVGVGAIDQTSGLSVGVAAPAKSIREVIKGPQPLLPPHQSGHMNALAATPTKSVAADDEPVAEHYSPASAAAPPNKAAAFAEFKASPEGVKLAKALRDHQEQLQTQRKSAAELSLRVNETKAVIDVMAQQLEQRRLDRQARGEDEIVDTEEFELVKKLKERKGEYRQLYDALSSAKTARDQLIRLVDHDKQQLLAVFETWYQRSFVEESVRGPAASKSGAARGRRAPDGDDDQLDEGERFELLELNRVMDEDPDSVAYYQAKKAASAKPTGGGAVPIGGGNRRARGASFSPPRARR